MTLTDHDHPRSWPPVEDEDTARQAVAVLPAVLVLLGLVHLTGDEALLDTFGPALADAAELPFSYRVLRDPDKAPSRPPDPAVAAELRERLLTRLLAGGPPELPVPRPDLFARMARIALGFELAERDREMVRELAGFVTDTRIVAPTVAVPEDFRVLVIGAGMIGINLGVKLDQAGFDYTILEQRDAAGGTWTVNRFPNAAVDTPSSEYSFSFELNPSWTRYFPTGPEYLRYVTMVTDKYDVRRHIHFDTTMRRCEWDDQRRVWIVTAERAGETVTYEANVVINALGFLNRPNVPDLPGRDQFQGAVVHSAAWDDSVDFTDRRVVLVGTGCTAAQVATGVADASGSLSIVQRQANWVMPNAKVLEPVGELERWALEHVPYLGQWQRVQSMWPGLGLGRYRPEITFDADWHASSGGVSALNDQISELGRDYIARHFADRPELAAALTPSFPPFAKRQVLDCGYFETLNKPNVELVPGEVVGFEPDGVRLGDGTFLGADIVVLATGFTLDFFSTLEIVGRDGRDLQEAWSPYPRAYLGLTVPGFPNLFITCGPNSGLSTPSHTTLGEQQVHYIIEALQLMLERHLAAIEVTGEAFEDYNAQLALDLDRTVFQGHKGNAHGYYRHASGRSVLAYPRTNIEFWLDLRRPNLEHYRKTPLARSGP